VNVKTGCLLRVKGAKRAAEFVISSTGLVERNEDGDEATVAFFEAPGDIAPVGRERFLFVTVVARSSASPEYRRTVRQGYLDANSRLKLDHDDLQATEDIWELDVLVNSSLTDAIRSKAAVGTKAPKPAEILSGVRDPVTTADAAQKTARMAAEQAMGDADAANEACRTAGAGATSAAAVAACKEAKDASVLAKNAEKAAGTAKSASMAAMEAASAAGLDRIAAAGARAFARAKELDAAADNTAGKPQKEQAARDAAQGVVVADAALASDEASLLQAAAVASQAAFIVIGAADAARAASTSAAVQASSATAGACMTPLGAFELPSTSSKKTITLSMGSGPTTAPTPVIHGDPLVSAWATHVNANDPVTFTWQLGGSTAADLPELIAKAVAQVFPKALPQPLGATGPPTKVLPGSEVPLRCSDRKDPLAQFKSVARTSDALRGRLIRDRSYTVSACMGDCSAKRASDATWTVSDPLPGTPNVLYTVTGPKLLAPPAPSAEPSPNKPQGKFNSPPGWDWMLLTNITWDFDLGSLKNGGLFPAYQWRPTQSIGASQEVYELDSVPQPLQQASLSFALGFLFPEGNCGRAGFGAGPSLLWGTGTNGALQQWTIDFVWSPPSTAFWDKLYFVVGGGVRLASQLVGDQQGETVALGRTAAAPAAPITSPQPTPVLSIGIGLDLSAIGSAVAAVTGTKTSGAGQ
jgi:hypothetical protein